MLLGVDVGGTFTDAVLVNKGIIIKQAKVKTTQEEVLQGILQALDIVLAGNDQEVIFSCCCFQYYSYQCLNRR